MEMEQERKIIFAELHINAPSGHTIEKNRCIHIHVLLHTCAIVKNKITTFYNLLPARISMAASNSCNNSVSVALILVRAK